MNLGKAEMIYVYNSHLMNLGRADKKGDKYIWLLCDCDSS